MASSVEFQVERQELEMKKSSPNIEGIKDARYKELAKVYFGETDGNRIQQVRALEEKLMKTSPDLLHNVPGLKDDFLLMMLRAGGFDIDAAITMLTNYVKMIRNGPKYFQVAFSEGSPKAKLSFDQCVQSILPHMDKFGRRVLIFSLGRWNPDVLKFTDIFATGCMMAEMVVQDEKTQIAGMTVVCDCTGFSLKHFTNITLTDLKYLAMIAQDSFPIWFRGIHLVHLPRLSHVMFQMIKPILSQRIRDAIVFHNSNETLHSYVDKDILPEELGGNAGKLNNEESVEAVLKMPELFQNIHKYIYQTKS